jgi:hypothetical protein
MNASTPDQASGLMFSVYITDLMFQLGNTKVSAILPTGQVFCGMIVADFRNCKG